MFAEPSKDLKQLRESKDVRFYFKSIENTFTIESQLFPCQFNAKQQKSIASIVEFQERGDE